MRSERRLARRHRSGSRGFAGLLAAACLATFFVLPGSRQVPHAQEASPAEESQVGTAGDQSAGGEAAPDVATIRGEVALLEAQVDQATRGGFHLLLDPAASELRLMFGGVVLQRYPFTAANLGTPRIAFLAADAPAPADWRTKPWTGGALVPARAVESRLTQPSDPAAEPVPEGLPPTAEEAIPVPRRYRIRFDEGFALDVVQAPDAEAGRWARARAAWWDGVLDAGSALWGGEGLRLQVTAGAEASASLYRSLPDDITLLVAAGPDRP
jgi:hypothetical protein